jgi:hypothetical protein
MFSTEMGPWLCISLLDYLTKGGIRDEEIEDWQITLEEVKKGGIRCTNGSLYQRY